MKHSPIGGAVQSFDLLSKQYKNEPKLNTYTLNSNRFKSRILTLIYVVIKVIVNLPFYDKLMINASARGFMIVGPFYYLIARIFRKKIIFRIFGGSLDHIYIKSNFLLKKIHERTTFKSDTFFLQTNFLINFFNDKIHNLHWLPTSRPLPEKRFKKRFNKKVIFLGRLIKEKGTEELNWLSKNINHEYSLAIYGPIGDDFSRVLLKSNDCYHGKLKPSDVINTLLQYDILILPTHFSGEGYPGVIIEAFGAGIPCVASDWRSIPELVIEGQNGYLFPTMDKQAMLQCIYKINNENYERLSKNAYKQAQKLNSKTVNKQTLETIISC